MTGVKLSQIICGLDQRPVQALNTQHSYISRQWLKLSYIRSWASRDDNKIGEKVPKQVICKVGLCHF